jgi:hypothetical protein
VNYFIWDNRNWVPINPDQLGHQVKSTWSLNDITLITITDSDLPSNHYIGCKVNDQGDRIFAEQKDAIKVELYDKPHLYLIPPSAFLGTDISNKLTIMTQGHPKEEIHGYEADVNDACS